MFRLCEAFFATIFALQSVGYMSRIEAAPTLPFIWGQYSVEPMDEEPTGYYWIVAEVQLKESSRISTNRCKNKTYLLEEWSSRSSGEFRLDIVDQATGWRQTILNKGDQERYHYRPFNCFGFKRAKDIIKADLTDIFPEPLRGDQLLLTGIGSIWEYVSDAMQYDYVEANPKDSNSKHKTRWDVLEYDEYDKFIMKETAKYPFTVKFLFYPAQWKLQDPTGLAGIQLSRNVKSIDNHILFRIIRFENSRDLIEPHLFQLPLGYGCYAKDRPGHEYEPPKELQGNEADGRPFVLEMDIVTHLPIDLNHDKWRTHSSFLRITRGTLTLGQRYAREYYMYQSQQNAPTLQSLRRIWDLGEPDSNVDKRERNRQHARYYDIDEVTGVCNGFEENQFDQIANIEFPMCIGSDQSHNASKCDLQWAGMVMDEKELQKLFVSRDGYKLVRSDTTFLAKQIFHYERRDQRFVLRNKAGSMVWVGPVSIVRKYTKIFPQYSKTIVPPPSPIDSEVQVIINFLSKDSQQIIGKVSLELLPVRRIDQAQFHRELSRIGVCYENPTGLNARERLAPNDIYLFDQKDKIKRKANTIDFLVIYLIGIGNQQDLQNSPGNDLSEDQLKALARNGKMYEQIYEKFIESMVAVSDHRLDPKQFTNVEVEIVKDVVRITGTLVEISALLAYRRLEGQKFSRSCSKWVQTEIKKDENKCAESCHHYQCSAFVYCPKSDRCDLLHFDDEQQELQSRTFSVTYEPDDNCDLFEQRQSNQLTLSSMQFFHVFNRKIASRSGNTDGEMGTDLDIELAFKPDDSKQESMPLVLRPDLPKIRSNSNPRLKTDYENLLLSAPMSGDISQYRPQATDSFVDIVDDNIRNELRSEYMVLLADRKFKYNLASSSDDFPVKLAKNIDEEQCELLCDNSDCNSFSYCRLEQTCLISLLHRQDVIEPLTESAAFCNIVTLDYMSKFEISQQQAKPPEQVTKSLVAPSQHDCAIHCVEEADFKCRAFYYCHKTTVQSDVTSPVPNCLLQRELQLIRRDELSITPMELVPQANDATVSECHVFSRSYMTEFDKFYGKRITLEARESDADYVVTRTGLNAEGCSLECAQRFGKCFAFHVCHAEKEPICKMMVLDESIIDEVVNKSQSRWIGLDLHRRLEDSSGCTTFSVAKGSRLLAALIANALMKDDEIGDKGELAEELLENELADQKVLSRGESFFAALMLVSFGIGIGYLAGFLYNRRSISLPRVNGPGACFRRCNELIRGEK